MPTSAHFHHTNRPTKFFELKKVQTTFSRRDSVLRKSGGMVDRYTVLEIFAVTLDSKDSSVKAQSPSYIQCDRSHLMQSPHCTPSHRRQMLLPTEPNLYFFWDTSSNYSSRSSGSSGVERPIAVRMVRGSIPRHCFLFMPASTKMVAPPEVPQAHRTAAGLSCCVCCQVVSYCSRTRTSDAYSDTVRGGQTIMPTDDIPPSIEQ